MSSANQLQPPTGFLNRVRFFNKRYLNRLTIKIARSNHGPFTVVRHIGRRSGKTYEIPIIVRRIPSGFVFALTYGPGVDWYQNILAAGRCEVIHHGQEVALTAPETISAQAGTQAFEFPFRPILRLLKKEHFFKMKFEEAQTIKD
jgi:deazaflavin-dependent oxidoreductase (nitroreductase family)